MIHGRKQQPVTSKTVTIRLGFVCLRTHRVSSLLSMGFFVLAAFMSKHRTRLPRELNAWRWNYRSRLPACSLGQAVKTSRKAGRRINRLNSGKLEFFFFLFFLGYFLIMLPDRQVGWQISKGILQGGGMRNEERWLLNDLVTFAEQH